MRTIGPGGRRGFAAAAVVVCAGIAAAGLGGCGGSGGPGGGTGPVPDPERDGCAPYAWYTGGDVPVRPAAAWIGGLIEDIAVGDGLAVLASRACGMRVVDVSEPAAPRLLGAAACPQAVDVALDGRLAAVAEGDRGVALYDLADPARPELLARVGITGPGETSRYTDAVALAGDLLFAAGFHRQLVCFDVADPRAPVEKGRLVLDRPGDLAVVGDRLFAGGRAVVRVGAGGRLSLDHELGQGAAEDLLVAGDRVYAAVAGGVALFDAAAPDTVVTARVLSISRARCLAAAGDLVFVGTAPPAARLKAFAWPDPAAVPDLVLDTRAADFAALYSLAHVDGTLLVGDRWLRTVDVGDPAAPVFAPAPGEPAYPQGLAVCGDHAVVVDGPLAAVYALADGPATAPRAAYSLGQSILHLTAGGRGIVYLARNASGLVVLAPAAGTAPQLVHATEWFGPLAASDSLLVTGSGGVLRVYGLADPLQPVALGQLDFGDYVRKVAVAGDRALVSLAAAQLVLVDLSDPTRPVEVARDPGTVVYKDSAAVAWSDSLGFDYHTDGLLRIVRPVAGAGLVTVGAVATQGEGRGLVRQGPVLYALSGGTWGGASYLTVLDLTDPVRPVAAGRAQRPDDTLTHLAQGEGFLYALSPGGLVRFWPDCLAVE